MPSRGQKPDTGAGEGEAGVTFHLSTIFHWSISKHITGSSSLILPEEAPDLKGSLGRVGAAVSSVLWWHLQGLWFRKAVKGGGSWTKRK